MNVIIENVIQINSETMKNGYVSAKIQENIMCRIKIMFGY